jgi:hypothetical protein
MARNPDAGPRGPVRLWQGRARGRSACWHRSEAAHSPAPENVRAALASGPRRRRGAPRRVIVYATDARPRMRSTRPTRTFPAGQPSAPSPYPIAVLRPLGPSPDAEPFRAPSCTRPKVAAVLTARFGFTRLSSDAHARGMGDYRLSPEGEALSPPRPSCRPLMAWPGSSPRLRFPGKVLRATPSSTAPLVGPPSPGVIRLAVAVLFGSHRPDPAPWRGKRSLRAASSCSCWTGACARCRGHGRCLLMVAGRSRPSDRGGPDRPAGRPPRALLGASRPARRTSFDHAPP